MATLLSNLYQTQMPRLLPSIRLFQEAGMNVVTVEDNGVGFDPSRLDTEHFGLFSIRERLKDVGGELHIEASPGQGTRVRLSLPVTSEEAETIN